MKMRVRERSMRSKDRILGIDGLNFIRLPMRTILNLIMCKFRDDRLDMVDN
jgi:hypothetical protein